MSVEGLNCVLRWISWILIAILTYVHHLHHKSNHTLQQLRSLHFYTLLIFQAAHSNTFREETLHLPQLSSPTKTFAASGCGWKERTRGAASRPTRLAGEFDFPTPPPLLARAIPRGTRPRAAIGGFSRLRGSHLNTPRFVARRGGAGSNWAKYRERRYTMGPSAARTHCWKACPSVTHRAPLVVASGQT